MLRLRFVAPEGYAAEQAFFGCEAFDHGEGLLISNGQSVFLSWMTRADGYRLLPVEAAP